MFGQDKRIFFKSPGKGRGCGILKFIDALFFDLTV
jgi:hypothetical protein